MKKIGVLVVLLMLIFSCGTKNVTVEKKFDVVTKVSLNSGSATVQLKIGENDYAITSVTTEIPQFIPGDSLTGRFIKNQLQAVKDNKGVWLNVSKLR